MKFLLNRLFFQARETECLNLNVFRVFFCLFLAVPIFWVSLPIGTFRPITFVELSRISIETTEQLFILKISLIASLVLAAWGWWGRFFLGLSAAMLLILASNVYSYLYDPITRYMPQELNLAWLVLVILFLSPKITHFRLPDLLNYSSLNPKVTAPVWPRYLILFSLGWVYFSAFISKTFFGPWSFLNADVFRGHLLEFGLFRENSISIWLAQQTTLSSWASLLTLLFEATALIGFSYRPLRVSYGIVGLGFHLLVFLLFGIDFLTKYLPIYFVLIDWSKIKWFKQTSHINL